jgi:hypothetical protein
LLGNGFPTGVEGAVLRAVAVTSGKRRGRVFAVGIGLAIAAARGGSGARTTVRFRTTGLGCVAETAWLGL